MPTAIQELDQLTLYQYRAMWHFSLGGKGAGFHRGMLKSLIRRGYIEEYDNTTDVGARVLYRLTARGDKLLTDSGAHLTWRAERGTVE
jgi:hypothetical protein